MTSEGLITAPEGITLDEAKKILAKARKEKLPIVDKDFHLKGLITIKDIENRSNTHSQPKMISAVFSVVPALVLPEI